MEIYLRLVDLTVAEERAALSTFVNQNYDSPIGLEESTIVASRIVFFWALEKGTETRVGVSAYLPKTRFLAETMKTVIERGFRGQGLGAKLSLLIESEVKSRGFTKIMTTIYVTNLPMLFIKLKQGYLFEGFHPNHEKLGLHEYSLGKVLIPIPQ